jgi:hypothetical protein
LYFILIFNFFSSFRQNQTKVYTLKPKLWKT